MQQEEKHKSTVAYEAKFLKKIFIKLKQGNKDEEIKQELEK